MTDVRATFEVLGRATRELVVEDGLTVAEVARIAYEQADGVSLCHQCGREADDLELGELTQLVVNGVVYVPDEEREWL